MHNDELNEDVKHWLRRERFKLFRADNILNNPSQVRDTVGVYVLLIRRLEQILAGAGLHQTESLIKWSFGEYRHAYTGRSAAMLSRGLHHLIGEVRDSAVRQNLLALQFCDGILWGPSELNLRLWESNLTQWLHENAIIAFRYCEGIGEVGKIESQMIECLPSPFNTEGNRASPFVEVLAQKRARFWLQVKATDQIRHRKPQMASEWLLEPARSHRAGIQSKHST